MINMLQLHYVFVSVDGFVCLLVKMSMFTNLSVIRTQSRFNNECKLLTDSSTSSTLNNLPSPLELLHVLMPDFEVTLARIVHLKEHGL